MASQAQNPSLQDLDEELIESGVPLRFRPLECFNRLHGTVRDVPKRRELFDPITSWYLKKYGDEALWDGVIGRFPLLIRGGLYLGVSRFVEGDELMVDVKSNIESLPELIASSLTPEEYRPIAEKLTIAYNNFGSLYNLSLEEDCLPVKERGWIWRARFDLENAAATLKHTGDTQTAVFQAHAAVEKFFKAALSKAGSALNPEKFGHNIPKIFRELEKVEPRYGWPIKPALNIQSLFAPNMGLRYEQVALSMEDAVAAFHGSLFICGTISQMWLFDKARGTSRSTFRACRFYVNGPGNTYYCQQVKGRLATLTLFNSSKYIGSQMADIRMDLNLSALYLEVTDSKRDAQLSSQLQTHHRNRGRRVTAEEIGLNSVSGVEGSYTTAVIRRKVKKP